jgi:hypothetical protein
MPDLRILTLHLAQPIEYSRAKGNPSEELLLFEGEDFSQGKNAWGIEPGDYLFAQWREDDFLSPEEGMTRFARHAESMKKETSGPWLLRILREDGATAFQGLRKIKKG